MNEYKHNSTLDSSSGRRHKQTNTDSLHTLNNFSDENDVSFPLIQNEASRKDNSSKSCFSDIQAPSSSNTINMYTYGSKQSKLLNRKRNRLRHGNTKATQDYLDQADENQQNSISNNNNYNWKSNIPIKPKDQTASLVSKRSLHKESKQRYNDLQNTDSDSSDDFKSLTPKRSLASRNHSQKLGNGNNKQLVNYGTPSSEPPSRDIDNINTLYENTTTNRLSDTRIPRKGENSLSLTKVNVKQTTPQRASMKTKGSRIVPGNAIIPNSTRSPVDSFMNKKHTITNRTAMELEDDPIHSDTSPTSKSKLNSNRSDRNHSFVMDFHDHSEYMHLYSNREIELSENNVLSSTSTVNKKSTGINPSSFHDKSPKDTTTRRQLRSSISHSHYDTPKRTTRSSSKFYEEEEEFSLTPQKKQKRSSSKKSTEVITIDDSDDESTFMSPSKNEISTSQSTKSTISDSSLRQTSDRSQKQSFGDRKRIDAARISIGKRVFKAGCELVFQPSTNQQYIGIQYRNRSDSKLHKVYINELDEMRYFISGDEVTTNDDEIENEDVTSFLALRAKPTERNQLSNLTNTYAQENEIKREDYDPMCGKTYIVIEFRNDEDFKEFLSNMRNNTNLGAFLSESKINDLDETKKYLVSLNKDSENERIQRLNSINSTRITRSSSKSGSTKSETEETMLIYPFDCARDELDTDADGLCELGDLICEKNDDGEAVWSKHHRHVIEGDNLSVSNRIETKNNRSHKLTITSDDLNRLEPGEYLNDTLIDFFMLWITRNDDLSKLNVHIFSTQFFTKLQKEGYETVASWTAKKNINIFTKKFIFVPINEKLHWSLLVIVNPGKIKNGIDFIQRDFDLDEAFDLRSDAPFLMLLDSLKVHRQAKISNCIKKWLDAEAKRLGLFTELSVENPFTSQISGCTKGSQMRIFQPKIPYQNNYCDCGVYVCRYAYGLYLLRHQRFTFQDLEESKVCMTKLTESPEFQFTSKDISRLRKEMKCLMTNLSKRYIANKKKEEEQRNQMKNAQRLVKENNKDENPCGIARTETHTLEVIHNENKSGGANVIQRESSASICNDSLDDENVSGVDAIKSQTVLEETTISIDKNEETDKLTIQLQNGADSKSISSEDTSTTEKISDQESQWI